MLGAPLAALVTLVTTTAVAWGAPATVTVRVEGLNATLAGRTKLTTTTAPVVKDGNSSHSCTGTSAAGALERATGGNWAGTWNASFGYSVDSVEGEAYPFSSGNYWTFVLNNAQASTGVCGAELQNGDQVLLYPCNPDPSYNCIPPLGLQAPARADRGQPFTVSVVRYNATGAASPASGATVAGGGATATTGTGGTATLTLPATGNATLVASRAGSVRDEQTVCVSNGNDGTCGTTAPGAAPSSPQTATSLGTAPVYRGPLAHLAGIQDGQRFRHGHGPRLLAGRVDLGTAGLQAIQLRLIGHRGGRCEYYSGRTETLHRVRCQAGWYAAAGSFFGIGDRADWSYLLPFRLSAGRWTVQVKALDRSGTTSTDAATFVVR
jgi:hypothetical protein